MDVLEKSPNVEIYPETYICNVTASHHLQVETTRSMMSGVSRIILATGYRFNLRRYGFLKELVAQHTIPLICGLPKLDPDLQFHPIENLFGTGTLAQLQIGPAAGNIAGSRLSYERFKGKLFKQLFF